MPEVEQDKILVSEEHFIWSVYHMMGNVGSRALSLKKACPTAKIILTIRRQPEYFISLFKYFQTIRHDHMGGQLMKIDNMLNLDLVISKASLCLWHGVPVGMDVDRKYQVRPIDDHYFHREKRHFVAADFSWFRLFEIYRELFGQENVLVLPQEMWGQEPNKALGLLESFMGEKSNNTKNLNNKRVNTTKSIASPFKTGDKESAFKKTVFDLNVTSNKSLNEALPYLELWKYGYVEQDGRDSFSRSYSLIDTAEKYVFSPKATRRFRGLENNLKSVGVWRTCKLIFNKCKRHIKGSFKHAIRFQYRNTRLKIDALHGVDFETMETVQSLGLDVGLSEQYESTKLFELKRVLRKIALPYGTVAMDIGAGKGRVVWFLSRIRKIDKVYGVEISKKLYEIADDNLRRLKSKNTVMINQNALDLQAGILDQCTLFYFYNPFPRSVFESVIKKISQSAKRIPRTFFIIYFNALYDDVIMNDGMCATKTVFKNAISSASMVVYTCDERGA